MPAHLRNQDISDRELLLIVDRVSDENGVASSEDIATALGIVSANGRSPKGRVSSRLAWMAREEFAQLLKVDPKTYGRKSKDTLWSITDLGFEILRGQLSKSLEEQIARADVGRQVLMMQGLAIYGLRNKQGGTAIRRQWNHNLRARS